MTDQARKARRAGLIVIALTIGAIVTIAVVGIAATVINEMAAC